MNYDQQFLRELRRQRHQRGGGSLISFGLLMGLVWILGEGFIHLLRKWYGY